MWTPTARRVHHWRQHFDAADARTLDGRAFWDRYAQRLQKAFDILAHHARSDLNHR
jgi:hypothetical protein